MEEQSANDSMMTARKDFFNHLVHWKYLNSSGWAESFYSFQVDQLFGIICDRDGNFHKRSIII